MRVSKHGTVAISNSCQKCCESYSAKILDHGKGGLSLRGGSLHDGFEGFDGSGKYLTLLLFVDYKIQHNEATVAVLTVLAVSVVMAVSVMTATPLKLSPPFLAILNYFCGACSKFYDL